MTVREEDGVGTPKLVIDHRRRPRKSVPMRSKYREFAGKIARRIPWYEHFLETLILAIATTVLAAVLIPVYVTLQSPTGLDMMTMGVLLGLVVATIGIFGAQMADYLVRVKG